MDGLQYRRLARIVSTYQHVDQVEVSLKIGEVLEARQMAVRKHDFPSFRKVDSTPAKPIVMWVRRAPAPDIRVSGGF